mmetsp:Transcript_2888/g.5071  ORF Transcript_2888/g.5071 Transcript_2888/m.5071 type:complete len:180 (+) Transcript_2888:78-617(+)
MDGTVAFGVGVCVGQRNGIVSSLSCGQKVMKFNRMEEHSKRRRRMNGMQMNVKYGGFDHAGMLVSSTADAMKFYTEVLGMVDDTHTRPNLPFRGAFVRAGPNAQLHLMELPSPDPKTGRPDHGGRDKHVALTVGNIDPLIESLNNHNVAFTMSKSGRRALFCRDPDGNALEFIERPSVE